MPSYEQTDGLILILIKIVRLPLYHSSMYLHTNRQTDLSSVLDKIVRSQVYHINSVDGFMRGQKGYNHFLGNANLSGCFFQNIRLSWTPFLVGFMVYFYSPINPYISAFRGLTILVSFGFIYFS